MNHYINDETGRVKGYMFEGARLMTAEEFELLRKPRQTLSDLRERKRSELECACKEAIVNTLFESNALGSSHSYDCRQEDQSNLAIAVVGGDGDEIYAHTQPAFEKRFHSHQQCTRLAKDMRAHIQERRNKRAELLAQVSAINEDTPENRALLESITW